MVEPDRPYITIQYGACPFHAVQIRLHTHTHPEYTIVIDFHKNNRCTNAPQYYVMRTLPVLFIDNSSEVQNANYEES